MQFFNFRNQETFHCFQWFVYSGKADPDVLIANALTKVGQSALVEIDLATAYLVKEELEKMLRAAFDNAKAAWFEQNHFSPNRYTVQQCADNGDYADMDAMFVTLVEHSVSNISFGTVAEAVLRYKGKWLSEG